MSDTKFTPGPWVIHKGVPMDEDVEIRSDDVTVICAVSFGNPTLDIADDPDYEFKPHELLQQANARLIAAAPDLYAALWELTESVLASHGSKTDFARREAAIYQAVDAMRKARGES